MEEMIIGMATYMGYIMGTFLGLSFIFMMVQLFMTLTCINPGIDRRQEIYQHIYYEFLVLSAILFSMHFYSLGGNYMYLHSQQTSGDHIILSFKSTKNNTIDQGIIKDGQRTTLIKMMEKFEMENPEICMYFDDWLEDEQHTLSTVSSTAESTKSSRTTPMPNHHQQTERMRQTTSRQTTSEVTDCPLAPAAASITKVSDAPKNGNLTQFDITDLEDFSVKFYDWVIEKAIYAKRRQLSFNFPGPVTTPSLKETPPVRDFWHCDEAHGTCQLKDIPEPETTEHWKGKYQECRSESTETDVKKDQAETKVPETTPTSISTSKPPPQWTETDVKKDQAETKVPGTTPTSIGTSKPPPQWTETEVKKDQAETKVPGSTPASISTSKPPPQWTETNVKKWHQDGHSPSTSVTSPKSSVPEDRQPTTTPSTVGTKSTKPSGGNKCLKLEII